MSLTIYGIKNCDTMKKARNWLEENGHAAMFHDYKLKGIDRETLENWVDKLGYEIVLNKAGTTFKKLDEDVRRDLTREKAIDLMLAQPSMIKRPVLTDGSRLIIGFKPDLYEAFFAA